VARIDHAGLRPHRRDAKADVVVAAFRLEALAEG
jgi:hypothetical protein